MTRIKYKRCASCKETLAQTEFYKKRGNVDGLKYLCKTCIKEQEKKRVMRLVQFRKESKLYTDDEKVCTGCDRLKPMSEFHKRNQNLDGRAGLCKKCKSERTREYRKKKKQGQHTYYDNPLVRLLSAAMEDSHVEVYI